MKVTFLVFTLAAMPLLASNAAIAQGAKVDQKNICRAAIAANMSRDVAIVKVNKQAGDVTHVSYVRPDDGKRWEYRCKLEGSRVLWATPDGRWRNHPMDEVIRYVVKGDGIEIERKYSDGSGEKKVFSAKELAQ